MSHLFHSNRSYEKNHSNVDETYTNSIEDKIVSILSGEASQEEIAEVRRWLAESADNRKLYNDYLFIWNISGVIGRKDGYRTEAAWTSLDKQMTAQRHPALYALSWKKAMMVAAVAGIVFLAGMRVSRFTGKPADEQHMLTYAEHTSPYGSKSKVKLPDGSQVWLNAGSTLRYSSDYNTNRREVYLEGEGYFDVTRNEKTPFWVQTSTITVKVLGTAFNVKAYPEESFVETIVERGAVQLIDPLSKSKEMTVLRAHQKAVVEKGSQPEVEPEAEAPEQEVKPEEGVKPSSYIPIAAVKVNSEVRTEAYTSWKDTRWVIEREKLSTFAVKLERRYNVRFVFADDDLKDYVFSGKFEDETLDQLLEVLKLSAPILYRVKQNTVYLSRNKLFTN